MIKSKKIATSLSCLVLCLLTLCSVFVLSGCGGISIDVKANYLLHPVFSGCNGKGSVELELNYKNVDYAVQSYINNDKYSDIYSLVSDIDFELEDESVNGKLKNDDSFKVITKFLLALYTVVTALAANLVESLLITTVVVAFDAV